MAQFSNVPENTNGGSIPECRIDGKPDLSCDDEIGAGGILEQGGAGGNKVREELLHSILPGDYPLRFASLNNVLPYKDSCFFSKLKQDRRWDDLKTGLPLVRVRLLTYLLLNQRAARDGECEIAHLDRCATRGGQSDTAHLAGMQQIIPEVEFVNQNNVLLNQDTNLDKEKLNQDAAAGGNEVCTAQMAGPQFYLLPDPIRALNNMSSPANNPPGFSTIRPRNNMFLESHKIDIKDEQTQSTDFVIQKQNNKELLEMSAAMSYTLYATGMHTTALMSKYYLRTVLVLLAISLTCFFAVKVFYKKLPHKFANLATSLAIACNGFSVLLYVGFLFAKI